MNNINDLRKNIDHIDDNIIKLLEDRYKLVEKIGKIKKENNLNVYDKKREEIIYKKIDNSTFSYKNEIKKIYDEIITISKEIQ